MQLALKRPIIFFDLETTGINVSTDRIVEMSALKVTPEQQEIVKTWRVNPQKPIPKEAANIHGITDEDVKDLPAFPQVAKQVEDFLEGCDLAGYNSNRFDLPVLVEEFLRAERDLKLEKRNVVDVQRIFHLMEKRTLEAAFQFYCGKTLTNAHSAEADAWATYEVMCSQLERYQEDLENDIPFLDKFTKDGNFVDIGRRMIYKDGKPYFNFGKNKGRAVEQVLQEEPQYYDWMMKKNFPLDTKRKLTEIKLNMAHS